MSWLSLGLPAYDQAITRVYDQIDIGLHMQDNLLRLFPPRILQHQGKTRQVTNPQILDTSMRLYRATINLQPEMFLRTDTEQFCKFAVDLVVNLHNQRKVHVREVMFKTSGAVGNFIDGKDRNVWDVYIEALEKVALRFDEIGRPLPAVFLSSEQATKFATVAPTDQQLKRSAEIVNNKREKFLANKRKRRLI